MNLNILPTVEATNAAATGVLTGWLRTPGVRNVMLAAGNSPLELYRRVAQAGLDLAHLRIFALDEYVGVPLEEPRNCAHLIRRTAVDPWGVPEAAYFTLSSLATDAVASVERHQRRIEEAGGLDVLVLGLGQNGHLGFNEPGSAPDSQGRVVDLEPISTEANRLWFGGDYAPSRGVTVGLATVLAARRILILATGSHKAAAARAMVEGPRTSQCPASFLQGHPAVEVLLDAAAAANLSQSARAAASRP